MSLTTSPDLNERLCLSMLPLPKTPSKVDDGIEKIKQSLSTKWGIQFPVRDATYSPSKRNMSLAEEKILVLIQLLYFRGGALAYAIENFEKNAAQIISRWQFKPHGEPDVLLSLEVSKSTLKQDFLKKRPALSQKAITELTENLKHFLSLTADRVQAGEKFPRSVKIEDQPIPTNESSPTKPNLSKRQSSLAPWLRSRSEPGPAKGEVLPAQQPSSSDDYPDHEMAELMVNSDAVDTSLAVPTQAAYARKAGESTKLEQRSSSEETFETPPSTPPRRKNSSFGPFADRKRLHPDSMQAPPSRNVSRKISNEKSAQESIYQHYPGQVAQNKGSESESARLLGSFDNTASISSSMTSASSAWTSPNTSFSARSLATSFDASVDGTDTTIRGFWDNPSRPPLLRHSVSGSESDVAKWYEDGASKVLTDKTRAPSDPRHLDSEFVSINKTSFEAEPLYLQRQVEAKTSETLVCELLAKRLDASSPFVQVPEHYPPVPFRQLYEISRVAGFCKLDISNFFTSFKSTFESYNSLWSSLSSIAKARGAQVPERSSLAAWDRAGSKFEGVALTGKLKLVDQQKGPCFEFHLSPLKVEHSYRLSRQFGSDRFCVLGIPGLGPEGLPSYLKQYHTSAREAITKWLVDTEHKFLGRTWRAFYTKPDASKKKGMRNSMKDSRYRIYLFAEDGVGFRDRDRRGEADPRVLDRPRKTVKDMIEWFMPFKANLNQPSLKFFARLALGVSSTVATVDFKPQEIFRADDARADSPGPWRLSYKRSDEKKRQKRPSKSKASVMNDGCARISRRAARGVADCLGLDNVPCVFQGRIGGAKGMWMIDPQDETPSKQGRNYWIEITDSQLKFEGHALDDLHPDLARVTFEVNAWAKRLSSSSLNFQLLPILVDRGVPPDVFARLLDEDLTARVGELEVAMDSGLALRKWNQEIHPITEERERYGGIEMEGGLPLSRAETINWFTEHGFQPKTCRFLKDQLYQAIKAYCLRLESKMNIGLGQSTYPYMIADPLAILDEDEIHLGFSSVFHDPKSGFDQSMLHNIDVLVARFPAHLPSDVQKVRAVFKPELMMYRDVIVFPSKGSVSLASKLSGGDYDGDQAWVCWDPDIVQPFRNADVPPAPELESYGIEKDSSTVADLLAHPNYTNMFLRHAFNFNLQASMLGICTLYHEAYCYRENAVDSPQAISIAGLLGNLVDSAKGGFQFDETKWAAYLKKNNLFRTLSKPAYKDSQRAKPTGHLIDHLVFVVAKRVRQKALSEFNKHFIDVGPLDDDLSRLRNEEAEEAKSNKSLANVLKNLETDLKAIHTFWRVNARPEDSDEDTRLPRKSDAPSFRTIIERCRADFVNLKPTLDEYPPAERSDRISSWQRDHARGRSSYWDLLKASVAFSLYYQTTFIWHMAGIELGEIKAMARGRGTYRAVVGEVFDAFKLDRRVVDGARRREIREREGGMGVEGDEDEDEFGVWDWGIDDC